MWSRPWKAGTSLWDSLPTRRSSDRPVGRRVDPAVLVQQRQPVVLPGPALRALRDRPVVAVERELRSEEPRLNSSHRYISDAVVCLKKKTERLKWFDYLIIIMIVLKLSRLRLLSATSSSIDVVATLEGGHLSVGLVTYTALFRSPCGAPSGPSSSRSTATTGRTPRSSATSSPRPAGCRC